MNTKQKGDIAVSFAICYFVNSGYEVCLPIGNKRDYDMIVEKEGKLNTVQIKFAGVYQGGKCKVGLRITGGNQSFNYTKKYTKDAFDILFVYTGKGDCYVIPWNKVLTRNEITIDTNKYNKYKVSVGGGVVNRN